MPDEQLENIPVILLLFFLPSVLLQLTRTARGSLEKTAITLNSNFFSSKSSQEWVSLRPLTKGLGIFTTKEIVDKLQKNHN